MFCKVSSIAYNHHTHIHPLLSFKHIQIQSEGHPVKPVIVGHGVFMERSLQDIKDLSCCGWLSGISLAEAYASSDILLFPSGVETFGNVTLEAQASGCVSVVEEKCSGT